MEASPFLYCSDFQLKALFTWQHMAYGKWHMACGIWRRHMAMRISAYSAFMHIFAHMCANIQCWAVGAIWRNRMASPRIYALFGVQFEALKIELAYKKRQITDIGVPWLWYRIVNYFSSYLLLLPYFSIIFSSRLSKVAEQQSQRPLSLDSIAVPLFTIRNKNPKNSDCEMSWLV